MRIISKNYAEFNMYTLSLWQLCSVDRFYEFSIDDGESIITLFAKPIPEIKACTFMHLTLLGYNKDQTNRKLSDGILTIRERKKLILPSLIAS